MKFRLPLVLLGLAALAYVVAVQAQENSGGKKPVDKVAEIRESLTLREQILARQFAEFQESLLKLKQRLQLSPKKEDQERALVLERALAKAKDASISTQFEQMVDFLKTEKLSSVGEIKKALDRSNKLAEDLRDLLALLREDSRASKLRDESERLKALLKELERIIHEQRVVQGQTDLGKTERGELKNIQAKVTEATEKLARKLGGQGSEGKNSRGDPKGQGKEGGKKGEGKDLGKAAANDKGYSKSGEGKGGEAKGDKGGQGGEGQQGESKSGGQGKEGGAKSGEGQQGESKSGGSGKEGGAKDGGAQSGSKGGESKQGEGKGGQSASKGGGEGKQGEAKGGAKAGGAQGGAGKKGEGKAGGQGGKEGSAKGGGKGGGESKEDAKSGGQGGGEGKQGEAKGGQGGQGSAKSGGQSGGQQGGSKGDNGGQQGGPQKPQDNVANGKKQVQDGNYEQQKAEDNISKKDNKSASDNQGEAIKKFEEAKKKLEDLLRQIREEELERLLAALQVRCERMLNMQIAVLNGTEQVFKAIQTAADHKPARDEQQRSLKLSDDEKEIVVEATKALELLEAEGSGVAFPEVFIQVREDMKHVQRRLGVVDAGVVTQAIERDIIDTLKEMIEALKKAKQDMDKNKPGPPKEGQPPPNQDQKLLDQIAELKMIRSMQVRVNTRTQVYGKLYQEREGEQTADLNLRQELNNLAERQERIFEVTNRIAKGDNK